MSENKNPFTEPVDVTLAFDQGDVQQNRVMAIFAYLSWLVLIPIFAAKNSPFARFHANQGLLLAIIEAASWIVLGILSWIPYIGWLFLILMWGISVVCTVFAVLGIVAAARGQAKEIPFIGGIRILK